MLLLIDPDAVHEHKLGGAVFRYKEAPCDVVARMKGEHADDLGRLDTVAFRRALLLAFVVGWEGVGDRDGTEVPFSPDVLARVVDHLPEHVAQGLDIRILALYREGEASGKDSGTGSSG